MTNNPIEKPKKTPKGPKKTKTIKRLKGSTIIPLTYLKEIQTMVAMGRSILDIQQWLRLEKGILVAVPTIYRMIGSVRKTRCEVVSSTVTSATKLYYESDLLTIQKVIDALELEFFKDTSDLKAVKVFTEALYRFIRLRLEFSSTSTVSTTKSDKISDEAEKLILSKLGIKPDELRELSIKIEKES